MNDLLNQATVPVLNRKRTYRSGSSSSAEEAGGGGEHHAAAPTTAIDISSMNSNRTTTPAISPTPGLKPETTRRSTRAAQNDALADLKNRLVQEALNDAPDAPLKRLVRLVAVEAEARAWLTSFPLLLFPALLEEKLHEARRYVVRQRRVWPGA